METIAVQPKVKGGIDYDAIAKGWLDILGERDLHTDEGNLTVIAFGMLPKEHFDFLMKSIFEKIATDMVQPGRTFEGLDWEDVCNAFKKEWKSKIEHEMSVAVYRNARMVV